MGKIKIMSLILLSLLVTSLGYAKVGRQAVRQTGDQPLIVAKGDIPTPQEYLPAIDAYMQSATTVLSNVNAAVEQLLNSLEQQDMAMAKANYIRGHYLYEIIRPLVLVFGSADRAINARADYFIDGVMNPNFSGFHAVEYYLFAQNDLSRTQVEARKLLRQLADMHKRVKIETILIPKLVQAAPDLAENILENKLSGMDNLYSGADLGEIVANLEGVELIMEALGTFLPEAYQTQVQQEINDIKQTLVPYQVDEGYQPYAALNQGDQSTLYAKVSQLAETLAQLRGLLAIDVYHKFRPQ